MTALHKKESVYRPALFLLGTEPHDLTFFPEAPSLKGPVTSIPPQWGSSFCYRKLWGTYPNSIADLDSPRAGNEPACVTEWSLDPSIRPGPMQRGRLGWKEDGEFPEHFGSEVLLVTLEPRRKLYGSKCKDGVNGGGWSPGGFPSRSV